MAPMPPAAPEPASSTVISKKPRGTSGQAINVKTNVYPLTIQKKIPYFKHDFRVRINVTVDGKEFTRELSNSCRYFDDDTRKTANVSVLHALARMQPFVKKSLIYDRAAILFTLEKIIKDDEELTLTLPRAALGRNEAFNAVREVIVTVKKATDKYQITSDDYSTAAGADFIEGADKSIFELLNIATSQCVVDHQNECSADSKSRIYILNPREYAVEEEMDIGDGMILRTSIKKSVKTVENVLKEGKIVQPIPALILDVTRTAMHKEELLSAKFRMLKEWNMLELKVRKTYGNKEILTVKGFVGPIGNCTMEKDGKRIKITQYLKSAYNITLREPNLPGVLDRKGNTYAPELLTVLLQTVTQKQYTSNTSKAVIFANAVLPDNRMETINSLTNALHLDGDKAKNMGIQINEKHLAIKVAGRQLPAKKLLYGKAHTTMGFQREFREVFYPGAGSSFKWAFLVVSGKAYEGTEKKIVDRAKGLATSFNMPSFVLRGLSNETVYDGLGRAAAAGCTFALVISDYDGDHETIKTAERDFGIMTQEVRGRNIDRVAGDTGANIVLKMNVKAGGVNHVVADEPLLLREDLLIMSLVFDHPSSMTKKEMEDGARPMCPTVVGISSNATVLKVGGKIIPESCQNFTEKFAYANPREWQQEGEPTFKETVFDLIRHEVEAFKNERGKPARQIIVYVSGVPEAERGNWSRDGKALVSDVCHTFSQAYNPFTTIITMSMEGCERLVADGRPPNQKGPDPRIGIVVDSVIVNPYANEFFLQASKALKGTPRTIKYTLVAEPTNAASQRTMDELEKLTWALTHLHQYCQGTISIPVPSRIAEDAAKRARNLFKYQQTREPYNLEDLNTKLGYKSLKLTNIRSV